MGVEAVRSSAAQDYIYSLSAREKDAVDASVATMAGLVLLGIDLSGLTLPVEGSRGSLIARIEKVHASHHRIIVEVTSNEAEAKKRTLETAGQLVSRGIGKRPDLPTGSEYVERVRGVWKGLGLSGRRAP
ncbi:MAG TPA: hypothetical protein VJB57_16590 [Dehalococcoidia bacterium]|nr:hypothetical protein [Dehalococcoidia bacterium]